MSERALPLAIPPNWDHDDAQVFRAGWDAAMKAAYEMRNHGHTRRDDAATVERIAEEIASGMLPGMRRPGESALASVAPQSAEAIRHTAAVVLEIARGDADV